jgi:hypothetical protein
MNEKLLELFKNMDDSDIVSVWNEYCYASNSYDDEILDYDRLEDLIKCDSQNDAFYWINRFFYGSDDYSNEGGANPNRDYFTFNGYGNIVSFDYIYNSYSEKFYHIDIDALIDYIVENKESFYNDDIQAILDEEENEEE